MPEEKIFTLQNSVQFRRQVLAFSAQFEHFAFLDSCNNTVYGETAFDYTLAAGNHRHISAEVGGAFEKLQHFLDENKSTCFGYLGYDLKNEIEKLESHNFDRIAFPDILFFIPEILIRVKNENIYISLVENQADYADEETVFNAVQNFAPSYEKSPYQNTLTAQIKKEDYLEKIHIIREHIIAGDIYEMNLCQEFFTADAHIEPHIVFEELCLSASAPFSVLFRWEEKYLISASPERFLKKDGDTLISQPIKGTIKRGKNPEEDAILKSTLPNSMKDRAENVMIVDLVRNDLTQSAKTGTIHVDELFGVYSFAQVHHLVSTISAKLRDNISISQILKNTFPMGSMTGAPKVMVMELIEQYEETKRGLFSGAFGYITGDNNFDFNVVIRSILYDATQHYISVQVGGAIVFDSDAEQEYDECVMKIAVIKKIIENREGGER